MTQDEQISKDQEIRHQYVRRLVLAGEVIVVFPPLAEPLISCRTRQATYPNFVATERPEQARERIRLTAGGTRINAAGNRVAHAGGSVVSHVTYPRFNVSVRPEPTQERIRLNTGGSVVSPVLYSLEFRQAWKKITDDSRNRS